MWPLMMPGMTYFPVASMTASGTQPLGTRPTAAIRPPSTQMFAGPKGGSAFP
jgi:hypothetical protein